MPVVPFTPLPPQQRQREVPAKDEPWLLMAAAQMDAQGRLFHPNIEDRRDENPDFIMTVQHPGEQLPMHAVDKLGAEAGADILDKELVDKWLKQRGK